MTSNSQPVYNNNNNNDNVDYNDDTFTEMGSLSDLKSVPSATVIASAYNSPIQSSESEGYEDDEHEGSKLKTKSQRHKRKKWPKFKRFRDSIGGEEAIYELVEPQPSKGFFTLCSDLVTLSSISIFVASNLFAFTVGMLVGKRMAYEYDF